MPALLLYSDEVKPLALGNRCDLYCSSKLHVWINRLHTLMEYYSDIKHTELEPHLWNCRDVCRETRKEVAQILISHEAFFVKLNRDRHLLSMYVCGHVHRGGTGQSKAVRVRHQDVNPGSMMVLEEWGWGNKKGRYWPKWRNVSMRIVHRKCRF